MAKNNKLKIIFFVFFVILVLINSYGVLGYLYNITSVCKDNVCIEGKKAVWDVVISNNGKSTVEYISIELLDSINNTKFASLEIPFNPQSDKRGDLIVVHPYEKISVNITGVLPKANYGQELLYYPCFTTTITDTYLIARDSKYEVKQCYKTNETMQVFKCVSSNNCNENEYCSFNKCLKISCKSCQYIKDHICMNYECCGNLECKQNAFCKNNTCESLNCNFNQYLENHSCKTLNCAMDEIIFNKTCKKLECNIDESSFNHTCRRLNCSESNFIQNRTCKILECKQNEYAKNHVCNKLNCLNNETIFNHECKALNCYFFQYQLNHFCFNDKSIIFKLSLEIIAIIAIVSFFIIDFKKIRS